MRSLLLLGVVAAALAGPALAGVSEDPAAACVTLDDRPCYSEARPEISADARQAVAAAAAQSDLAQRYARDQVAKGNCSLAWSSAQRSGDQALQAEIRQTCAIKPQPKAAAPAVKLW